MIDIRGFNDAIIPANVSGGWNGRPGPHDSTVSSDGFYYSTVDQVCEAYAVANDCREPSRHFLTPWDGLRQFYCVAPHGGCKNGADVVRCAGQWGHTWPWHVSWREGYSELVW